MFHRLLSASLLILVLACPACEEKPIGGYLMVRGPEAASFEIYRVESETPLQLVSEHTGTFNSTIPLLPRPARYVLACNWYDNPRASRARAQNRNRSQIKLT